MENEQQVSGSWNGQLVDIHGFNGEIALTLGTEKTGKVTGDYRVSIGGHHDSLVAKGQVSGSLARGKLKLSIAMREPPVKMGFDADLIALRGGGSGLRGTYQVSARGYSPLQGGIVILAKDRKQETELISRSDRSEGVH